MPSLLATTIRNLATARAIAREIVDGEITAARIYLQIGDDGQTYELGRTIAKRGQTQDEIKESIRQLLLELAERWKT